MLKKIFWTGVLILLLGFLLKLTFGEIEIGNDKSWCFDRYRMYNYQIRDMRKQEGIEKSVFSTYWTFPYLYIYGMSGYTKITAVPFYTKIEKIPNKVFYNYISSYNDEPISVYHYSLNHLKNTYGDSLIIYNSLKSINYKDYIIFNELKVKGEVYYNLTKQSYQGDLLDGLEEIE